MQQVFQLSAKKRVGNTSLPHSPPFQLSLQVKWMFKGGAALHSFAFLKSHYELRVFEIYVQSWLSRPLAIVSYADFRNYLSIDLH